MLLNKIFTSMSFFLLLITCCSSPFAQDGIISADQIEKGLIFNEQKKDLQIESGSSSNTTTRGAATQGATRQFVRFDDNQELQAGSSVSLSAVTFEYDSAVLTDKAKKQLKELAVALSSKSLVGKSFELVGHTDARGGEQYNLSLSQRRARSVVDYLQNNYSVATENIKAYGLGESRLADPNNPTAGINRRVEIIAK